MKEFVLVVHIVFGLLLIILPIIILQLKNKISIKWLSVITATVSWLLLIPSAILYVIFYPATKVTIKAGSWPWAHSIVMETKEHWSLLLPIIATLAAGLVLSKREKESKKWWILLIILSFVIAVMGRIITIGAIK